MIQKRCCSLGQMFMPPQQIKFYLKLKRNSSTGLVIGLEINAKVDLITFFSGKGLKLERMTRHDGSGRSDYLPDVETDRVSSEMPNQLKDFLGAMNFGTETHTKWQVSRDRCFLKIDATIQRQDGSVVAKFELKPTFDVEPHLLEIIPSSRAAEQTNPRLSCDFHWPHFSPAHLMVIQQV